MGVARCSQLARRSLSSTCQRLHYKEEPPYLDTYRPVSLSVSETCASPEQAGGPEVPDYPLVNVQIKGYDFTVLEHYGKWIHSTALNMGIDVEDGWATPCEKQHIQTFKPNTNKVEADYYLQIYERNIQMADLPSIMAPVFLEVVQAGLPQGVELNVHEHQPEYTEVGCPLAVLGPHSETPLHCTSTTVKRLHSS
ncbi:39S ribosomal protein L48, mitochondrial [Portunus trituberculatus]|uniref:39S ribosomal protein L48, mitochondrial n=1 Tax=Portunus trituberculatus TaxID=210409 RepID=A0A5B7FAR5_PORTR|nr:39S ribosomal protein L48, mitochondrial [Portunus trituberculatus]